MARPAWWSGWLRGRRRRVGSRAKPGRVSAPVLLLALGCIIAAAVLHQAWAAVRSQQATVDKLMRDYSAVAVWSYQRHAAERLFEGLHHLLNPGCPPLDRPQGAPAAAADFIKLEQPTCRCAGLPTVDGAIAFPLDGGPLETAGTMPAGLDPAVLRADLLERPFPQGERATHRAFAFHEQNGATYPVAFTVRRYGGESFVYAIPLAPDALEPFFADIFAKGSLLPHALTGPEGSQSLLAMEVAAPTGAVLFASSPAGTMLAADTLAPAFGHLIVRGATRPEAAERLVIGGLPASRLPLLVALLAMTVGLLAVAVGQMRRAERLARLRTDFVSSVSHELRTPLALQRVALDTLRLGRARDDATRNRSLENIDRETTRLTHLVGNLLRFQRVEQDRARLSIQEADLSAELEDVTGNFRHLVAPEEVNVAARIEPGILAPIDRDAVRQVVLNLLENAVKYGPPGQTITTTLCLHGDEAIITVDDEGHGIPARERERVWVAFQRGEAAIGTAAAGSGIGLAVVREIVHGHGGTATILDAPAGGARIRVALPDGRRAAPSAPLDPRRPALAHG